MPGCRCTGGCVCAITDGDGETVALSVVGNGSAGAPFVITAEAILVPDGDAPLTGANPLKSASNGLYALLALLDILDTDSIDLGITGDGSVATPYVVTAAARLKSDADSPLVFANPLKLDSDGLYVDGVNLSSHGGMEVYQDHGNAGTTETLDLANGNVHRIVLDSASCAITLAGSTSGVACSMTVIVDQASSAVPGVLTWVNNVDFNNATAPTLATGNDDRDVLTLLTVDGGTRWLCFHCATDMG